VVLNTVTSIVKKNNRFRLFPHILFPSSSTVEQAAVTRKDVGAEPTLGAMTYNSHKFDF